MKKKSFVFKYINTIEISLNEYKIDYCDTIAKFPLNITPKKLPLYYKKKAQK